MAEISFDDLLFSDNVIQTASTNGVVVSPQHASMIKGRAPSDEVILIAKRFTHELDERFLANLIEPIKQRPSLVCDSTIVQLAIRHVFVNDKFHYLPNSGR